ncbi:MAG TPA: pyruvate dehydrogenase complex dihydrolipoamide acetyltransferase, partial [Pelagibacterium sp.]|nr:pyruvate dehydrogenase complex dihydrolipoamide acetyltransferase [Pelagibacterium sp.]
LPAPKSDGKRVFASPLARRLAKDAGIDLAAVSGSGPKGRVIKADIEKAKKDGVSTKPGTAPATGAPLAAGLGKNQVLA